MNFMNYSIDKQLMYVIVSTILFFLMFIPFVQNIGVMYTSLSIFPLAFLVSYEKISHKILLIIFVFITVNIIGSVVFLKNISEISFLELIGLQILIFSFLILYDKYIKETTISKAFEIKYKRLFENTHESIYLIDPRTGVFLDANEATAKKLGYTKEEFLQLHVEDIDVDTSQEDINKN